MSATIPSAQPTSVGLAPEQLARIQAEFVRDWLQIASDARQGRVQCPSDRRFNNPAWAASQAGLLTAQAYLLSVRALEQMVDAAQVAEPVRKRLRFAVMQWVQAMSPSNFFATNPDAQHAMIESNGQSLGLGIGNLLGDLQKGRLSQTDETRFRVGEQVAATPGAVVYENPYMQLIQYAPLTENVAAQPLLIVPPCINKFYILDLQPENSFVRYALQQGLTVFLVSWRNPLPADTDGIQSATWADYLQHGVLAAIDVVRDISKQKRIGALGFCVGGTLLASALALARARGDDPVAALTLVATFLDFADTGALDVFVDEQQVRMRELQLGRAGLMSARELATTFAFLRPNELIWNYVVDNYLKGHTPAPFDLLYWNADGTNLPGPFFTWYLRNAYLENNLKTSGCVRIDGHALDLGSLTMPVYIFGSRQDHIVPWVSAYASTGLLRGSLRFVLGASGHIAGVVNPPVKNKRHYWAHKTESDGAQFPADPHEWLNGATQHSGSWWPDWAAWQIARSGRPTAARTRLGSARYKSVEPAPGRYVRTRAI